MSSLTQSLRMAITAALTMAYAFADDLPLRDNTAPIVETVFSSDIEPQGVAPTQATIEMPVPWWRESIESPLGISPRHAPITADEAMVMSLSQSPDIQVFSVQPDILLTEITRQQANFDWNTFLESAWNDRSDPIGSTLQTGSVDGRFEDQHLTAGGGLRKSTKTGAQWELAERFGNQRNNSVFLVPNPQSTSRMELILTQPLLAGRGESYNLRRVVEARLVAEGSRAQSIANVQDYLLQVHQRYWDLYRARAIFLQRRRAAERASELAQSLHERTQLDTTSRQLIRSRTAASQRRAELMTAVTAADLAAIELRRVIGMADYEAELIPMQSPMVFEVPTDPSIAIQTALAHREEIDSAVREVRVASVRLGASKNELMPKLDFIAGAYVAGLTPDGAVVDAFGRQFSEGRPSYNFGLAWERAAGNRAARSTLHRRQLELQEMVARYEAAIQDVRRDVEVAIHQVHLSYRTLLQRHESLAATQAEADYLLDRWNTSPNSDGPAILLLEDLINSQTRLAEEETLTVNAETEHAVAHVRYLRAIGSLLQCQNPAAMPSQAGPPVENPMIDGPIVSQELVRSRATNDSLPPPVVDRPRPTRLPSPSITPSTGKADDDGNSMLDGNVLPPSSASNVEGAVRP